MQSRPFLVHALSPVHAGVGRSADLIDLPIARMRATGIPIIPGSSIKGVLRDHTRTQAAPQHRAVFGPDKNNASEHAGALIVGDAVLLALPVRSMVGTFAWVSAPLLLRLAARDLDWPVELPQLDSHAALVAPGSRCLHRNKVYLEELDLPASEDPRLTPWADRLAALACPEQDILTSRLVVVDDETMTFLLETATQVDARVRLEEGSRTVADGALWLEESLPAETLLLGLMAAEHSRSQLVMSPAQVLAFALGEREHVQLGGKATIGRGRCELIPIAPEGGPR